MSTAYKYRAIAMAAELVSCLVSSHRSNWSMSRAPLALDPPAIIGEQKKKKRKEKEIKPSSRLSVQFLLFLLFLSPT